jgi:ribokinase
VQALRIEAERLRYRALVGTGGIGSGVFFALSGSRTLGREESRGGRFLDRRDYCKLHIISHYVQTLLGPEFETIALGKVGDDEVGSRLLAEMREGGLNVEHVERCPDQQTLYSFCFMYPDGSGGNLTTDDSASSKVEAGFIEEAEGEFSRYAGGGIALAAPEVPLEAREAALDLGSRYQFLRAASFTSEEMGAAAESGLLRKVDLLGVNLEEAAAGGGLTLTEGEPVARVVEQAVERLTRVNPHLLVSITAGTRGSWTWDGRSLTHMPKCDVEPVSCAGAGDAHLSGLIVGLAAGLSLAQAHELAALVAGLSVTSPHTINKEIGRGTLRQLAGDCGARLSEGVRDLLAE